MSQRLVLHQHFSMANERFQVLSLYQVAVLAVTDDLSNSTVESCDHRLSRCACLDVDQTERFPPARGHDDNIR